MCADRVCSVAGDCVFVMAMGTRLDMSVDGLALRIKSKNCWLFDRSYFSGCSLSRRTRKADRQQHIKRGLIPRYRDELVRAFHGVVSILSNDSSENESRHTVGETSRQLTAKAWLATMTKDMTFFCFPRSGGSGLPTDGRPLSTPSAGDCGDTRPTRTHAFSTWTSRTPSSASPASRAKSDKLHQTLRDTATCSTRGTASSCSA